MAGNRGGSPPAGGENLLRSVELLAPADLEEALEMLGGRGERTVPIAGGTDLISASRSGSGRLRGVRRLVDVGSLGELVCLRRRGSTLCLGASTTFTDLLNEPLVERHFPLLRGAAERIGSVQIRNRATLVGNVVNNAPCADSLPALLVYDASLGVRSSTGERRVPLREFLAGLYQVALGGGELVTEIVLPVPPARLFGTYLKLGRRRGAAISRITLAVLLELDSDRVREVRLAAGAVTPVSRRFAEIEMLARGERAGRDLFARISRELGRRIIRITGERPSSGYKIPVVQQLCCRALCTTYSEYRQARPW